MTEPVTDAYARELLGRLLHYRDLDRTDPVNARRMWVGRAVAEAETLFSALLAWADRALCGAGIPSTSPGQSSRRRRAIADRLQAGLPLPGLARIELAKALHALDEGQVDDLVRPKVTKRRAHAPADTIDAQIRLLTWIEWQAGLGQPKQSAKQAAADAIGLSPAVFDQWLHVELKDRRDSFAPALMWARWHGEAEARGEKLLDSVWEHDGDIRDLPKLAAAFKRARWGT